MKFVTASNLDHALAEVAAGARPVAGGSDLVVGHRHGKAPLPDHIVAIDRVVGLGEVTEHAGGLTIGALVNHHRIEHDATIVRVVPALADASALVGSPATRHVGTIGGNVMNASPAMDTGAPLLVLGAEVELRSTEGSRRVPVGDLWTGPGRTTAAANELCVAVHVPATAPRSSSAYVRLEYRRAMEIAVVGAAASVTLDGNGNLAAVAIALTAVAPTILAVSGLDAILGRAVDEGLLDEIAALASAQARPISDVRAGEAYRRHTVGIMAKRAVHAAARRAAGETIPVPVNRSTGIGAPS